VAVVALAAIYFVFVRKLLNKPKAATAPGAPATPEVPQQPPATP
jgi:hypothetical protein